MGYIGIDLGLRESQIATLIEAGELVDNSRADFTMSASCLGFRRLGRRDAAAQDAAALLIDLNPVDVQVLDPHVVEAPRVAAGPNEHPEARLHRDPAHQSLRATPFLR